MLEYSSDYGLDMYTRPHGVGENFNYLDKGYLTFDLAIGVNFGKTHVAE